MKLTVSRREFADALKVMQKAVAVKAQTPILSGIYLRAEGSTLELQATNYTLGIISKVAAVVEEDGEIVLLGKTLFEMVQKLSSFSEKQANFNFNNIFVTTLLISGGFPPFDRLFNEEKTIFVEVNAQDFLQAIERVAVIAKVAEYEVVKLNFADNEIKISATSPDVVNAEEVVQAEIEGGELTISFNHNYLVDALKVAGDKTNYKESRKSLKDSPVLWRWKMMRISFLAT